jgi:hypothetical protein
MVDLLPSVFIPASLLPVEVVQCRKGQKSGTAFQPCSPVPPLMPRRGPQCAGFLPSSGWWLAQGPAGLAWVFAAIDAVRCGVDMPPAQLPRQVELWDTRPHKAPSGTEVLVCS